MNINGSEALTNMGINPEILDAGVLTIPFPGRNLHLPLNLDHLLASGEIIKSLLTNLVMDSTNNVSPTKESIETFFMKHLADSRVEHATVFAEFFWEIFAQERQNSKDRLLEQSEYYPENYYQETVISTFARLNQQQEPGQPEEN